MLDGALRDVSGVTLTLGASLLEALRTIESVDEKVALVVSHDGLLLGVVTDGDVRRYLIKGGSLADPVTAVMNTMPTVAQANWDRSSLLVLMRAKSLRHVPVVNDDGRLAGIFVGPERLITHRVDTPVLLMAGGFGRRLGQITATRPKPMVDIGGKPMLEIILKRLVLQGFEQFFVSLHYLPDLIRDHFGNGERWGCRIEYVMEASPLGTAGAVGLLPSFGGDLIVTNGDVVTNLDYTELLAHHRAKRADLTVCTRMHSVEVPYGVLSTENALVQCVVEKPVHEFLVNTGIYVLGEQARRSIMPHQSTPMTDVINSLISGRSRVASYVTEADWMDVGRPEDLVRIRQSTEAAAALGWMHEVAGGAQNTEPILIGETDSRARFAETA